MSRTIVEETITCEACPYQVEGKLSDGSYFYFRYRFSKVRIGVGASVRDAVRETLNVVYYDRSDIEGDQLSGILDYEEYRDYMARFLAENKELYE